MKYDEIREMGTDGTVPMMLTVPVVDRPAAGPVVPEVVRRRAVAGHRPVGV